MAPQVLPAQLVSPALLALQGLQVHVALLVLQAFRVQTVIRVRLVRQGLVA